MSQDKLFYEMEGIDNPDYDNIMCKQAQDYLDAFYSAAPFQLPTSADTISEFGAGSCAMAIAVAKHLNARHVICTDISARRMQLFIDQSMTFFNYFPEQVTLLEHDMNMPNTDIPNESVDVVITNGSLHHARNIWVCLAEAHRILKVSGQLWVMREALCPRLRTKVLVNVLATSEVQLGVSENCYLKDQYSFYLKANRFMPVAIPVVFGNFRLIKRLIGALNDWVYSNYAFIAKKLE